MREDIKIKFKYLAKMAPLYIVILAATAIEVAARRKHDL
jgi:hypothetical protein